MDQTGVCHDEDPAMGVWQRPLGQGGTNIPGVQFLIKNKFRCVTDKNYLNSVWQTLAASVIFVFCFFF